MKELVEYIARSIVDRPEKVSVSQVDFGTTVNLELQVARPDMGRIIGRQGRVAQSIRTLVRVAAARNGKRAHLEVIDPH